jgi:hypothetical protein
VVVQACESEIVIVPFHIVIILERNIQVPGNNSKLSHYSPGQALGAPGVGSSQNF